MSLVGNLHQPLNGPCSFSVQHMGLGVQLASAGAAVLKSFFQELYTRSIFFRNCTPGALFFLGAEQRNPILRVEFSYVVFPPLLSPSWGAPSLRMSLPLGCPFP